MMEIPKPETQRPIDTLYLKLGRHRVALPVSFTSLLERRIPSPTPARLKLMKKLLLSEIRDALPGAVDELLGLLYSEPAPPA